jgi:hypothetical protein
MLRCKFTKQEQREINGRMRAFAIVDYWLEPNELHELLAAFVGRFDSFFCGQIVAHAPGSYRTGDVPA